MASSLQTLVRGGQALRLARPAGVRPRRAAAAAARPAATAAAVDAPAPSPEAEAVHAAAAADPTPAPAPPPVLPADDDAARFPRLHWSVDMWRDFSSSDWLASRGAADGAGLLPTLRAAADAAAASGALASPQSATYWGYHLARTGYFVGNALLGLAASSLAGRAAGGGGAPPPADAPAMMSSRLQELVRKGWKGPVGEALLMYWQDARLIAEGAYAPPWDSPFETPSHRQNNPLFAARRTAQFVREAVATLRRRDAQAPDAPWLDSPFLPAYYRQGFHYQTDGWLSQRSASVYEVSTETLFLGRQDCMQRTALVAMSEFLEARPAGSPPPRVLEVAAGTGRFAMHVRNNFPGAQLTVSDLSPFYLAEARANADEWLRKRGPPGAAPPRFLQADAAALPEPDGAYDVVYCVYLFHELPADVRRAAAAEMARVLAPGGLLVLCDSVQLGDRRALDAGLGNFSAFQEPYYGDYIATPLAPLFIDAGLEPDMKVVGSTSKSLSFRKPAAAAAEP